ncbi:MAG: ParB N-terminal domain-containing protein [Saezia sp.]
MTPNDYNPITMAPAELKLLEASIQENGFTQPIVVQRTEVGFIIIDGYHRYSLVRKSKLLKQQTQGYVPVVILEHAERTALTAATVRHNRARRVTK